MVSDDTSGTSETLLSSTPCSLFSDATFRRIFYYFFLSVLNCHKTILETAKLFPLLSGPAFNWGPGCLCTLQQRPLLWKHALFHLLL